MIKENVLLYFIKVPVAGRVKTRLQPQLTQTQALLLYKAFVEDSIDLLKDSTLFDLNVFFYPEKSLSIIKKWLDKNLNFFPQNGNNLGEKMSNGFATVFKQGYKKAVLIGSDLPDLTTEHINLAFDKLEQNDLVIGPSDDGGYYLIAMKKHLPHLFENIEWSTSMVLPDTLDKFRQSNFTFFKLPQENDIDDFDDLVQFWGRLKSDKSKHSTKTYNMLKNFLPVEQRNKNGR